MRKKLRTGRAAIGVLLLMALALVSPVHPAEIDAVSNEVRCTEIAFSRSVETNNSEWFASFLDEDARFVGATVLRGGNEVIAGWAPFFAEGGPQLVWRPSIVEVAESGDIALSRGPYRMRGLNGEGQEVESWGIYNSVWRKSPGGQWQIIFDAGNAGENQVNEALKALIEMPVENCASGQ